MERVQQILNGSLLWRMLTALSLWCGAQWQRSVVVQSFLRPSAVDRAMSESSLFFRLWQWLRGGLSRLYELLHLDKLFCGSVFLRSFFWCALAAALGPILPTMPVLALVLVAYASLALDLVRDRTRALAFSPVNKYLLLFAGAYLVAVFASVTPSGSLLPGLLMISFVLFSLVVENVSITRRQLEGFTAILVLSATVIALYGVAQYLFGVTGADSWVDKDMFSSITTRVYATLQNPNMLAEYLVLILPLGAALLLTAKGWGQRVLWLCCCAVMSLSLLLTLSRGGWVGALIAGGVFVVLLSPKLILLAPVVLLALWFLLPDTFTARFASIGNMKDSSTSYRVSIWMGSIAMLKDYWLCGVGPGTEAFNLVYPAYSYHSANAQHAHNLFLQLMAEGGILVLVLFVVLVFSLCRRICVALKQNKRWDTRLFLIAVISGLGGFLAQGMTDHSFYNYRVALMFFVVVGLGAAWARFAQEEVAA